MSTPSSEANQILRRATALSATEPTNALEMLESGLVNARAELGIGNRTGVYDDQDRLTSYGPWTYTYTANGELASKTETNVGETSYTYDAMGNLLDVALPDGRLIEYLTDGRNRRIAKKVDGVVVRRWVYQDQLNPTAELDANGTVLYRYAYGSMAHSPDFVVSGSGETYRVIRDQLGSPLLVVNIHDENDILLEARYSAFGKRTVIAGDGSALTLGFAGGIYDADTGLTRFGARDYDATVGRWTSKDPLLFDAMTTNLFTYVAGDPVNFIDPSGEILRLAQRMAQGLKIAYQAGLDDATRAMRRGEGVYADTEAEARQFAQKFSSLNHGGGQTVLDAAQSGKYAHYHALDGRGRRLPGHVWFGKIGAFLFAVLDADGDGELTMVDVAEFENPFPVPLNPPIGCEVL